MMVERFRGHWRTVCRADAQRCRVSHHCVLCGYTVEHVPAADAAETEWERHNAEVRRLRALIAAHDLNCHPDQAEAQRFAEFRNELHNSLGPLHGLAAYQWADGLRLAGFRVPPKSMLP